MSLTSYRAAPPRAKSVQRELSRLRDFYTQEGRLQRPFVIGRADDVLRRFSVFALQNLITLPLADLAATYSPAS